MVAKIYCNAARFAESFQKLDDFRKSGETCDIRLLISNKEISAHKLVLASASEYFKNAIYGVFFNDTGKTELELKGIDYEILCTLVNYIYSGKIEINSENVNDIYIAADNFCFNFLKDMCLDFLKENIDTDNCGKIWIIANTCKHENLSIAAGNFIFSNLAIASNSKEYLSLSNEELWPKDELSDSIITSLLRWASDKENWEETVINILKDIPHTSISEDYLENFLSNNEIIQNNMACNYWMMNIYKEKLKCSRLKLVDPVGKLEEEITPEIEEKKLKLQSPEDEEKFRTFLLDEPLIFMKHTAYGTTLCQYNRRNGGLKFYNNRKCNFAADYETYKNWIYVVEDCCVRFPYDDIDSCSVEFAFRTNHGQYLRTAILHDSMHIFGGNSSKLKGSTINLNTNKYTSFILKDFRANAGVAATNGSIYICGGYHTNTIERFDPRERGTTHFGSIPASRGGKFCSAAILYNELYCFGNEYKMMDLRNNNKWVNIQPPVIGGYANCLISSNGKLYTNIGSGIYEYNNIFDRWKMLEYSTRLKLDNSPRVISFQ